MKRIHFGENNRSDDFLHIEVPGAIVNIRINLHDSEDRRVTSVQIIPDDYVGSEWDLDGHTNNRLVERKQ